MNLLKILHEVRPTGLARMGVPARPRMRKARRVPAGSGGVAGPESQTSP